MSEGIPYPLAYVDPEGRKWDMYEVHFDSPDGTFACHIYAISEDHARLQCEALKETARLSGRVYFVIPS